MGIKKKTLIVIKLKSVLIGGSNMAVVELTKENFDEEVLKSDKPVLVDFWAAWCGPCRMVAPVVEQIANENPEYKICKVDVDSQPEIAGRYQIMSIPSLFVFKDGKVHNQTVGVQSKENLLKMFD